MVKKDHVSISNTSTVEQVEYHPVVPATAGTDAVTIATTSRVSRIMFGRAIAASRPHWRRRNSLLLYGTQGIAKFVVDVAYPVQYYVDVADVASAASVAAVEYQPVVPATADADSVVISPASAVVSIDFTTP